MNDTEQLIFHVERIALQLTEATVAIERHTAQTAPRWVRVGNWIWNLANVICVSNEHGKSFVYTVGGGSWQITPDQAAQLQRQIGV